MKTLDLNACGVHEMNAEEMRNVDGGCPIAFAVAFGIAVLIAGVATDWEGITF
jgi:lactobin A/cerein 7B family class IIb bacteriocin